MIDWFKLISTQIYVPMHPIVGEKMLISVWFYTITSPSIKNTVSSQSVCAVHGILLAAHASSDTVDSNVGRPAFTLVQIGNYYCMDCQEIWCLEDES